MPSCGACPHSLACARTVTFARCCGLCSIRSSFGDAWLLRCLPRYSGRPLAKHMIILLGVLHGGTLAAACLSSSFSLLLRVFTLIPLPCHIYILARCGAGAHPCKAQRATPRAASIHGGETFSRSSALWYHPYLPSGVPRVRSRDGGARLALCRRQRRERMLAGRRSQHENAPHALAPVPATFFPSSTSVLEHHIYFPLASWVRGPSSKEVSDHRPQAAKLAKRRLRSFTPNFIRSHRFPLPSAWCARVTNPPSGRRQLTIGNKFDGVFSYQSGRLGLG